MTDELPEGWDIAALVDVSAINPRHDKTIDDKTMVTFAPMAAISEDSPDFLFREERPLGDVRKGFTHFADGDVLFAKITPCMENGKGAVARNLRNGLGCGTTEVHVARPLSGISPLYVYRYLSQSSVRRQAKENFTGTAGQLRVPTEFIKTLCIPVPPSAEQWRIAERLEKLLAEVEQCKERMAKIPVLLKRFRQSVLAAACSGRLTADWREEHEIDFASWGTKTIGSICEIIGGSQPPKKHFAYKAQEGYIRFIQIRDYKSDNNLTYIPKDMARRLCRKTDVMIGRYGPPLFQILRGIEGAYNVALMKAVPISSNELNNDFLFILLQDPPLRNYVISSSERTVGQDGVRKDLLEEYEANLPLIEEQEEIVRRVNVLFALADKIEAHYKATQQQIDRLPQSILAKAFRGELVPTEADLAAREGRSYESAAQLLQRIQSLKLDEPERKGASRKGPRRRDR